jgi:hypothetical protein
VKKMKFYNAAGTKAVVAAKLKLAPACYSSSKVGITLFVLVAWFLLA